MRAHRRDTPTTQRQHPLVAPAFGTVKPEVVKTPVPTMLATTMKVAIARPNSAGIDSFSTEVPPPGPIIVLRSGIIATIEVWKNTYEW
jgi:hypothetical protein